MLPMARDWAVIDMNGIGRRMPKPSLQILFSYQSLKSFSDLALLSIKSRKWFTHTYAPDPTKPNRAPEEKSGWSWTKVVIREMVLSVMIGSVKLSICST
ncbi:hypothetical protein ABKN59_006849 [Abortiporus biennis]